MNHGIRFVDLSTATVLVVCLVGGSVFGQQTVTVKGATYDGVELIKEYPQSVYIRHASGKTFLNKADINVNDARALGITSPVADPVQDVPDKDLQDVRAGNIHVPSEPPPAAQQLPPAPQPEAVLASRGNDAMNQWAQLGGVVGVDPEKLRDANRARSQHLLKNGSSPQPSVGSTDSRQAQEKALPNQRWMGNFDASSVRLAMFKQGLLPLKESEARDLFSGRDISPLSSRCALDAVKAAKVMLGLLGPEQLPQDYRKIARRNAPPTATARRTTSAPFDPSIFPVATAPASVPSGSSAFTAEPPPIHAHPVAAAGGDPQVHRMWHGADGSSATQQGNVLFHSDGRISHGAFPAGSQFNTFHSSDGSVHHQSGNAMFPAGGGAGMFGAP